MTITLEKATKEDAETLHALQIKCFLPLSGIGINLIFPYEALYENFA